MESVDKAEPILTLIKNHESERAVVVQGVPTAYDVVYSGIQSKHRPKQPLSTYPVAEVLEWQGFVIANDAKSSAAGAYQIIRRTLVGLKLKGTRKFNAACQDEAAVTLLERRGWLKCQQGKMTPESFADSLAKEWASLPVQKAQQGAHRWVTRGQSYYAGDGLNHASAEPEEVMLAIFEALAILPPELTLEERVEILEREVSALKAQINSA